MKRKVFISYSTVDKPHVQQIVELLRDGGFDPWFDHYIEGGRSWKDQLKSSINECDVFVYVLTPESIASEWCRWEFQQAIKLKKCVVTILLQKRTTLDSLLKQIQYIDFSDGFAPNSVARLMRSLMVAEPIVIEGKIEEIDNPNGIPSRVLQVVEGNEVGKVDKSIAEVEDPTLHSVDLNWPYLIQDLCVHFSLKHLNYDFDNFRPVRIADRILYISFPSDFPFNIKDAISRIAFFLEDVGINTITGVKEMD